jgi:acetyl esterase/lipase
MNKKIRFWVFLGVSFFLIPAWAFAEIAKADSSNFQQISNLVYGDAPDHRNELDIYLPRKHTKKTPMVVFIHGGFWSKGGKHQLPRPLIDLLVGKMGYSMASINYRFVKKGANKYPTQMDDVSQALQFLSNKADSI